MKKEHDMASNTKKTESIRERKAAKRGRGRKRALANNGSTPKFPIHPEKDSEKAK